MLDLKCGLMKLEYIIKHVIENEKRFSKTFLKEILSPFIKRDISEIKYPKKLSQKELIDNVEEYKNKFSYYDWTKYNN